MTRRTPQLLAALGFLLVLLLPVPAQAVPGFPDCKEAPTPEVPGRGITGFFTGEPEPIPPPGKAFGSDANTTIYEQYGYAGLRWHTYDLGCGPDAMRHPDAVIGTAIGNWLVQMPIALTALTGSVTEAAFTPNFLSGLDGAVERVSTGLHTNLFASWIPFVIASIGIMVIFKARKASLATSAAAVGWALIVVLLATALVRWPLEAGRAADATVTQTLGSVVSKIDGNGSDVDPGTAVASNVTESIFYRAWLAGTFGSPDSEVAKKYGFSLFNAQALSWHEAQILEQDPDRGRDIIEQKQQTWKVLAERVQDEDPEAYEHLTGARSETRIGYAVLSTVAAFLALPFLLMSALLLIGCFLIVRLSVMLFPAFATLGAFPAARGLVTGLGRTVGAALVNALIFGIGAGVTVAVLGMLFHPGGGSPAWLGIVLMPLFSAVMWVALRPFRRLTTMVSPDAQHFGNFEKPRWIKRAAVAGLGAVTSGAAAGVAAGAMVEGEERDKTSPPDRAEARPSVVPTKRVVGSETTPALPALAMAGAQGSSESHSPMSHPPAPERPAGPHHSGPSGAPELEPGFIPRASDDELEPAAPEEIEDDEVYVIYRPADDDAQASA